MDRCVCPECSLEHGEPSTETDLRWRNWSLAVAAGTNHREAYDRFLHPTTRIPAEQLGGRR